MQIALSLLAITDLRFVQSSSVTANYKLCLFSYPFISHKPAYLSVIILSNTSFSRVQAGKIY